MARSWWVSTLVDTVDPRHAWMLFVQLSKNSISMEIHPRMAWIYRNKSNRHREPVEGGAVSDCGVSAAWMPRPSPQGWVYGVPAIRHRPAQPTENPEPAVAVAFAVALALAVASAGAGCNPAAPLLR
ncbi:hypothetical protein FJP65_15900 [Stenotrophomonas maltophilia]|nr:hypothetical protein FJP65_15900 [Stenotrophomonas maltophilia]